MKTIININKDKIEEIVSIYKGDYSEQHNISSPASQPSKTLYQIQSFNKLSSYIQLIAPNYPLRVKTSDPY